MQFSHSRVECFKQCPYKYKLRYIDKIKTLDDYDPQDPLKIGTAIHECIQQDIKKAIKNYYMQYPIINDLHVNEALKMFYMGNKARNLLPLENAKYEVKLECDKFIGYIDMLVPNEDGTFDIYDFKYSNNIDKYMDSNQLHLYKYYSEKLLNIKIKKLYFVFIEKTMIRQKKTEDLREFRLRLKSTLENMNVQIKEVLYNPDKVIEFINDEIDLLECNDYIKNTSKLCDWCEYKEFCENKEDINMILPSTKRVEVKKNDYKKVWIYGVPFSGKTTLADQAPTPLNLNTDGNCKYVTMPRILIKDEVTTTGRLTNRKFAWEVFKDAISELEKGSEFETIVVDLLEDEYDNARIYMCDKNNWEHESDDSFKAYDIVRTEFLRELKKLLNLPYNIILISHENTSRDIMSKDKKITRIETNLPEKIANKVAGMVDIVARVVVNDDESRSLEFKYDSVVFGGGRLKNLKTNKVELSWDALCEVYDDAIEKMSYENKKVATTDKVEEIKEEVKIVKEVEETKEEVVENNEEQVRRTRRTRRVRED